MLQVLALSTAILGVLIGVALFFFADTVAGTTAGRLLMLLGLGVLPMVALAGGTVHAVNQSSSAEFCMGCHEMEPYGQSLFVEHKTVLPAVHYQKRLIDRDHACFACHTDYAMFGNAKAKLNGLHHVWVHYLGEVPEEFELYEPYPNHNCLHCHDDARSYLEQGAHQGKFESLAAGKESCLLCHSQGHALAAVEKGELWLGD